MNCPTIYFSISTCKLIVIFTQTKSLKNDNSDFASLTIPLWSPNQMGSANFILLTFWVDVTNVLKSSTQTFHQAKSKTQVFMFVWKNRTFGQLSKKWDNAWSFTLRRPLGCFLYLIGHALSFLWLCLHFSDFISGSEKFSYLIIHELLLDNPVCVEKFKPRSMMTI